MMPQKEKKMPKKTNIAKMPPAPDEGSDLSSAIGSVGTAISLVADEFDSIKYKIEEMSESINHMEIDTAISHLTEVMALSTIATHGTDEDRESVVEKLKQSYLRD
jgi:hypothetical protein